MLVVFFFFFFFFFFCNAPLYEIILAVSGMPFWLAIAIYERARKALASLAATPENT